MTINELAQAIPEEFDPTVYGSGVTAFESISYDSRQVFPGVLFVCLVGEKSDGHKFVKSAIEAGAVGVVIDKDRADEFAIGSVPFVAVTNTRRALPYVANIFYHNPSSAFELIGITGTNGKTTVSYMVAAIWRYRGHKTGVIGTVGANVDGIAFPTNWTVSTTPESLDLQQFFSQMREEKVDHVAIEVTSIAIDQERTTGLDFDTTIFTNLTQDHLDYHGSMEKYEAAKTRLFLDYAATKKQTFLAVLNGDDRAGVRLATACRAVGKRTVTYGIGNASVDFRAVDIVVKADRTLFTVVEKSGTVYPVSLPIGGLFNVANALSAIAATRSRGVDVETVQLGLESLDAVPGRFQPVEAGDLQFHVLVDYAHTPDGLENLLLSARALAPERLVVVFGCGGNRDRTKRPKMGRIAADLADVVVVTSDNPRKEDPDFIVSEILAGMPDSTDKNIHVIVNRREAIYYAIESLALPGDLIVIAGKGHETYQIAGDETFPFDDRIVAAEAIAKCS